MEVEPIVLSIIIAVATIGAAYGVLKSIANRNASDIARLVPKTECELRHSGVDDSLRDLRRCVKDQQKITGQLKNFAMYQLTVKDKMSLSDAKDILENGDN